MIFERGGGREPGWQFLMPIVDKYSMNAGILQQQLRQNRIKEGSVFKRTRLVQEWEERWGVLTMNYFLVFADSSLKVLTDSMELQSLKSYKSYIRRDDEMLAAAFRLASREETFYMCAKNIADKWNWVVVLERLMDFKANGKTGYNNYDAVFSQGFPSLQQNSKRPDVASKTKLQTLKQLKKMTESVSQMDSNDQVKRLVRNLQGQQQQLRIREKSLAQREKQQEEIVLAQFDKMKILQEEMKNTQIELAKMVKDVEAKFNSEKEKTRRLAKDNESLKKKILAMKKEQAEKKSLKTIDETEEDYPRRKTTDVTTSSAQQENEEQVKQIVGNRHTLKLAKREFNHQVTKKQAPIFEAQSVEPSQAMMPMKMTVETSHTDKLYEPQAKQTSEIGINTQESTEVEQILSPTKELNFETQVMRQSNESESERDSFTTVRSSDGFYTPRTSMLEVENTISYNQTFNKPQQNGDKPSMEDNPYALFKKENNLAIKKTEQSIIEPEDLDSSFTSIASNASNKSKRFDLTESVLHTRVSKVSEMKKLFESIITDRKSLIMSAPTAKAPVKKNFRHTMQQKKEQRITSNNEAMHQYRKQVVSNLFEEFTPLNPEKEAMKSIVEFLIKISYERNYGYQPLVISEVKSNTPRSVFTDTLIQTVTEFADYRAIESLCGFIELVLIEAPSLIKSDHFTNIKAKLIELFEWCQPHRKAKVIKAMYTVHRSSKFDRNPKIRQQIEAYGKKTTSLDVQGWCQRLLEDL